MFVFTYVLGKHLEIYPEKDKVDNLLGKFQVLAILNTIGDICEVLGYVNITTCAHIFFNFKLKLDFFYTMCGVMTHTWMSGSAGHC